MQGQRTLPQQISLPDLGTVPVHAHGKSDQRSAHPKGKAAGEDEHPIPTGDGVARIQCRCEGIKVGGPNQSLAIPFGRIDNLPQDPKGLPRNDKSPGDLEEDLIDRHDGEVPGGEQLCRVGHIPERPDRKDQAQVDNVGNRIEKEECVEGCVKSSVPGFVVDSVVLHDSVDAGHDSDSMNWWMEMDWGDMDRLDSRQKTCLRC